MIALRAYAIRKSVVIPQAPQGPSGAQGRAKALRFTWIPDQRYALSGMTTMGKQKVSQGLAIRLAAP
jgi:hypothetical protein